MKKKQIISRSLQFRLIFYLTVTIVITWLIATAFAWKEAKEYVDEFFDTQQLLLAKSISVSDFQFSEHLKKSYITFPDNKKWGEVDDDVLGFAIFTTDGKQLLSDKKFGKLFPFFKTVGFKEISINNEIWRIVWQPSPNGNFIVAVGQEKNYRNEIAFELLEEQITHWLVLLPILILGFILILYRELKPLRIIKNELEKRLPGDPKHLSSENMPSEIQPLVNTLNHHFEQVASLIERERVFIANAAHELRTPLAGLRIQAEVASLPETSESTRITALKNLISGIDRSSRLAEQLLLLARIETLPEENLAKEKFLWQNVIQNVISEYSEQATKKNIFFTIQENISLPPFKAPTIFPYILMRNLIDNAIRYAIENSEISIHINKEGIVIKNTCPVLQEKFFSRLGERFYRPSGQQSIGSGLGLSIVNQVASHLNLTLSLDKKRFDNPNQMIFIVFLRYNESLFLIS